MLTFCLQRWRRAHPKRQPRQPGPAAKALPTRGHPRAAATEPRSQRAGRSAVGSKLIAAGACCAGARALFGIQYSGCCLAARLRYAACQTRARAHTPSVALAAPGVSAVCWACLWRDGVGALSVRGFRWPRRGACGVGRSPCLVHPPIFLTHAVHGRIQFRCTDGQ